MSYDQQAAMPCLGYNCGQNMNGLGSVDLSILGTAAISDALKRLPGGDVVQIVKGLPQDVVERICKQGVADRVDSYVPWLMVGGLGLLAYIVFK